MKQQEMVKKVIFVIHPHSIVDVITNSSTELFVFDGKEKEIVEEMISNIYPNYRSEYEELKDVKDFSIEELNGFLWWHLGRKSNWWSSDRIYNNPVDYQTLSGFEFNEIYDTSVSLKPGGEYKIKNNKPESEMNNKYDTSFVTEENKERVIEAIIQDIGRYFLYSEDDNPDWDMQEELMNIGTRYHLG